MKAEEREKKIAQWAQKIAAHLREVLPAQPVEADFRRTIDPLLDDFCAQIGLTPLAHAEYTLATGRADAVFNRFVIEYKRPGVLKKTPDAATRDAIEQLKGYLISLAQKEGRQVERLAGVVLNGHFLIFVRYVDGKWSEEAPIEVNTHSLERFLTWLAGLSSGTALTSANLNGDFAIAQLRTQNILRGLFQALNSALATGGDGLVAKLFEQWRLFFSEAIDYSEAFGGRKLEPLKNWVRKAGLQVKTAEEAERFFFVLHTYFALLVKLLAWLALSRHLGVKVGAPPFAGLAVADGITLRRRLHDMESGGIFRAYGILNLLEGDFFAWYLYAWDERIEGAVREIIKRLDEYDPTTLSLLPEETRDLFKKLYHYLLPREVRHNLGEYYTPDWLAQRVLNQVDNEFFQSDPYRHETRLRRRLLSTRFLDPACGSGTFPVLIIARMLELGKALLVPERELLEGILRNVVGFDLNPLAVLTARVNYLLAIADLLPYAQSDITIPVYLADSVRTPALSEDLFSRDTYEFPTAVGTFRLPAVLCTAGRFDHFCNLLEDSLRAGLEAESFIRRVEHELALSPTGGGRPGWDDHAVSLTRALYERMLALHRQGMNGLWARLLKNNFAPLTIGQFDYIVGNPPWVNWENLPDKYRQATTHLWDCYGLAARKGRGQEQFELGKKKGDISALMTYVALDKLLRTGGKLGFVITQSVFKTGASQGFRRFRIPGEQGQSTPLAVFHVDDMVDLNPFEGAANRTAVMVLEKGKPTKYPVPYTVWRKTKGARFTYDSTLEEVEAATRRLQFSAEPVDPRDPTSPWLTARPKALRAVRKILGKSDYEAHAGAYTGGANAVYWVEVVMQRPDGLVVVRNITEGAKIQVEEAVEPIEPDLLYPLLRGRDVQRWKAEPSAWIIVPRLMSEPQCVISLSNMQRLFPRTYTYLKWFEGTLLKRADAMVKSALSRGEPFYFYGAVGDYTFAPWKVVWTRIAQIEASVISTRNGKSVIPQETVTLVECLSSEEAHYIAALVNSSPFQFAAVSYSQEGGKSMGSMHVLENIRIPRYNLSDPVHRRLAELSEAAHAAAVGAHGAAPLRDIEAEIDQQAARLWGLTEAELREIQTSLQELQS